MRATFPQQVVKATLCSLKLNYVKRQHQLDKYGQGNAWFLLYLYNYTMFMEVKNLLFGLFSQKGISPN